MDDARDDGGGPIGRLDNGWLRLTPDVLRALLWQVGGNKGVVLAAVLESTWGRDWWVFGSDAAHADSEPAELNASELARRTGISVAHLNDARRALVAEGVLREHGRNPKRYSVDKRFDCWRAPPAGKGKNGKKGGKVRAPIPARPELFAWCLDGRNAMADQRALADRPAPARARAAHWTRKPVRKPGPKPGQPVTRKAVIHDPDPGQPLTVNPPNGVTENPVNSAPVLFGREVFSLDGEELNSTPAPCEDGCNGPDPEPAEAPAPAARRAPHQPRDLVGTPADAPYRPGFGAAMHGDVTPTQALIDKAIVKSSDWFPNGDDVRAWVGRSVYLYPSDWFLRALKRVKLSQPGMSPGWKYFDAILTRWLRQGGPDPGKDDYFDDDLKPLPASALPAVTGNGNGNGNGWHRPGPDPVPLPERVSYSREEVLRGQGKLPPLSDLSALAPLVERFGAAEPGAGRGRSE